MKLVHGTAGKSPTRVAAIPSEAHPDQDFQDTGHVNIIVKHTEHSL